MDLNLAAVIFMGGYVLAIVGAALFMAFRPAGGVVKLPEAQPPPADLPLSREEILLGGEADEFGIPRGRVGAVLIRPSTGQIQAVALLAGLGLLEDRLVPASAIRSADGEVLHLAERWTEEPLDGPAADAVTLRGDMAVVSAERKRLGKLQLVCFDRDSKRVTGLVIEGRRSPDDLRLVPFEQVKEVGPSRIGTGVKASEWTSLQPFGSDRALRDAVVERLAADPVVRPVQRALTVEVQDQRMRIRGYVATRAQADRAAQIATSVPGVIRLESNIVNDEDLAIAVRQAVDRALGASAAAVRVRSRLGRVEVIGELPDLAAMQKVDDAASHVPGVLVVHNLTEVKQAV
jgi:osmotically-inducible protein OsmY